MSWIILARVGHTNFKNLVAIYAKILLEKAILINDTYQNNHSLKIDQNIKNKKFPFFIYFFE